ncbi:MAG: hypothetical protein NTX52_09140 [Planctomycetota bacterium]|nr:hypothetical protein [Planctomycetota bacterium]
MAKELGSSVRQVILFGVIVGWIPLVYLCSCSLSPREDESLTGFHETDSLGANAACYVCHIAFVTEEMSKTHLRANVTCIDCHGLSAGHANNENIGATPPDVSFTRDQVRPMCLKCHKDRDTSPKDVPVRKSQPACTDCHGSHRISKPAAANSSAAKEKTVYE